MIDLDGLVHVLATGDPQVWRRLLVEHVADRNGRCGRCSLGAGWGRPVWPCRLHTLAAAARLVDTRARARAGETDQPS
ncbi:MAG: hypothetical protein ACRDRK_14015 [Pseudonocardia sp.]